MKKMIVSTNQPIVCAKRLIFALMLMLTACVSASAMSYEQARNEALFLTDKMAYELNLTDAQYEAAYEINLDYLMSVATVDDVFGTFWERRNLDLSYILYSWQWDAFRAATYFYRPLYWDAGYWHFGIYARYPHRDYFYFGRPHFYATYRGGHSWHLNSGRSYYYGHREHFRPALPAGRQHVGMRDGFNRGDFRGSRAGSSTRITGRYGSSHYNDRGSFNRGNSGSFNHGNSNSFNRGNSNGNFDRSNGSENFNQGSSNINRNSNGNVTNGRFGGSSINRSSQSTPSRNFGSSSSVNHSSQSTPSRNFGSSSSVNRSSQSTPSRSFGSSSSHSSMGGSRSSMGGGHSSVGGSRSGVSSNSHGHFGGNRR